MRAGSVPVLPDVEPLAPPAMVSAIAVDQNALDLRALRTAQIRAKKEQEHSNLGGRLVLVVLLIAMAIGGALLFGRDYLFKTEWSPELLETVDLIEEFEGVPFDHPVGLTELSEADYAPLAAQLLVGDVWVDHLPEWRALGVATGEPTMDDVGAEVAARYPVVYSVENDMIYRLVGADPEAPTTLLATTVALRQAYQVGIGVERPASADATNALAVTDPAVFTQRMADVLWAHQHVVVDPSSEDVFDGAIPADDPPVTTAAEPVISGLPLPIVYEMEVLDGIEQREPADELAIVSALDRPGTPVGPPPILSEGDTTVGVPYAVSIDRWTMVFAAAMSESQATRAVEAIDANLYQSFTRSTQSCFAATFVTDESGLEALAAGLNVWVDAAPAAAGAQAALIGPTVVQLSACDPGAELARTPNAGAATLVATLAIDDVIGIPSSDPTGG